ncbi:hypothetical protein ABZX90_09835 [Streptomyces sp. NPDC002935]|uniref:hypothetical protein n=1 Tax=unclassified Streptomyces TaxID=2593676 RepID=UPI00332D5B18
MTIILILLTTSLVVTLALLAAIATGILARIDGATYPAAFMRGAAAFATVLTLASAVTAAMAAATR